jgi:hypothetical protein
MVENAHEEIKRSNLSHEPTGKKFVANSISSEPFQRTNISMQPLGPAPAY